MSAPRLPRGYIPVMLDRPRLLHFDLNASWALDHKYGSGFILKLYRTEKKGAQRRLILQSTEALVFFLHQGLQEDARRHGETLTSEQVQGMLHSWNYSEVFGRVVYAVIGSEPTKEMLAEAEAAGFKIPADLIPHPVRKQAAKKTTVPLPPRGKTKTSAKRTKLAPAA